MKRIPRVERGLDVPIHYPKNSTTRLRLFCFNISSDHLIKTSLLRFSNTNHNTHQDKTTAKSQTTPDLIISFLISHPTYVRHTPPFTPAPPHKYFIRAYGEGMRGRGLWVVGGLKPAVATIRINSAHSSLPKTLPYKKWPS